MDPSPRERDLECPLPPVPFDHFLFSAATDKPSQRAIQLLHRLTGDIAFDRLRYEVATISLCLRFELRIDVIDRELSTVFGKSGTRWRGMINRFDCQIESDEPIEDGRPGLVDSECDYPLLQFCPPVKETGLPRRSK
jgi:hypothetical protein